MKNIKKQKNYILLNCFFIVAILAIVTVYLFEVNAGISYSLRMKENDHRLANLNIRNEHLLKQATELGSMANIYITSKSLNMVKVTNADYLMPVDETLAER